MTDPAATLGDVIHQRPGGTKTVSRGELIYLVWNDLVGLSRTRGVPIAEYERRRPTGSAGALGRGRR